MSFDPAKTLPLHIATYLEDKIIRLDIKPGERIYEVKIAKETGVSQSPIREAFRILESLHLVEITPRKGTIVTEITENFIISVYDIFNELVGLATIKTALNRTDEDLVEIEEALDKVSDSVANGDLFEFNKSFFKWGMRCLDATYDPLLINILTGVTSSARRLQYYSLLYRDISTTHKLAGACELTTKYIAAKKDKDAAKNNRMHLAMEKDIILEVFRKHPM